ncbi:MAG: sulfite exporter TauE/SafE family protein [Chloroflexota bacterium]|nr:sulfite exporter TauE/SafE family protein [Chloroflexota bacterium]
MQGFLLGLANGTTCLAFCAPALIPFLMHEGQTVRQNLVTLAKFLGGRLGGYTLFGLLAWATGSLLLRAANYQSLVIGAAYVGLAALLLVAVLRKKGPAGACAFEGAQAKLSRWPALLPVGMGFLAGLKVCPPLLLAFTEAASTGTLTGSLVLFLTFFLGTSIYFIPLSFLGAFTRVTALRIVGQFAAVIVALYYLYSGILLLAGGIQQL